jgi:hypothetical protein
MTSSDEDSEDDDTETEPESGDEVLDVDKEAPAEIVVSGSGINSGAPGLPAVATPAPEVKVAV